MFHMSNPNPQPFNPKYRGVRDIGYKSFDKLVDPTDILRFGKRVNYDTKLTCD
jgi:hypothetical protein